jgi:hypothetical protein
MSNESRQRDTCVMAAAFVWLVGGTIVSSTLDVTLETCGVFPWYRWNGRYGEDDVLFFALWSMTLLFTSPLLARAVHRARRWTWPVADVSADLDGLSPELRGLVADARALRVALESEDEATLREVWDWQRRFEQLGEHDRRELEHLGLGDPGVAGLLRAIVAMPEHRLSSFGRSQRVRRGMRELSLALDLFEQRLLGARALFRGPFR